MKGELYLVGTGELVCEVHGVALEGTYFTGTVADSVGLDLHQSHILTLSQTAQSFDVTALWTLRRPGALRLNGKLNRR